VHNCLREVERRGGLPVCLDEAVDGFPKLPDGGTTQVPQGLIWRLKMLNHTSTILSQEE